MKIVTIIVRVLLGLIFGPMLQSFNLTNGAWYYYTEQIKVPTLWQVAKAAGKKTGNVDPDQVDLMRG